jgi:hypothetical protein
VLRQSSERAAGRGSSARYRDAVADRSMIRRCVPAELAPHERSWPFLRMCGASRDGEALPACGADRRRLHRRGAPKTAQRGRFTGMARRKLHNGAASSVWCAENCTTAIASPAWCAENCTTGPLHRRGAAKTAQRGRFIGVVRRKLHNGAASSTWCAENCTTAIASSVWCAENCTTAIASPVWCAENCTTAIASPAWCAENCTTAPPRRAIVLFARPERTHLTIRRRRVACLCALTVMAL